MNLAQNGGSMRKLLLSSDGLTLKPDTDSCMFHQITAGVFLQLSLKL